MSESSLPLETLSESGSPPRSRIKDAQSAVTICQNLFDAGQRRRLRWVEVDKMFDGSPPFMHTKLRAAGQAWRSNVNTMEGKAIMSTATTPFYDLFNSGPTFANIKLKLKDPIRASAVSKLVTSQFHEVLKGWDDFYFVIWPMLNDFVRHGRAYLGWPTSSDWKPKWIRYHRVYVPDATEINLNGLNLVCVQQNASVSMLWEKIRNKDAAGKMGWNIDAVMTAIRNATPNDRKSGQDVVDIEDSLRDNDILVDSSADIIKLSHLYVKEFSGKWTHNIVLRDSIPKSRSGKNLEQQFLYRKHDAYDEACNFIAPFFFEVINGSWNGASGLGKDIHAIISHKDRIWNAMMDAVYLRTGINLQATDATALRRISSVQVGGSMNVWPPGFNAIQANVLGDLQGAISITQLNDQMIERNTGIFRPRVQRDKGNPETATEFQAKFSQSMVLQSSAIDRFYVMMDRAYTEMWRRFSSVESNRKMLLDELKAKGVTDADLKAEACVQATRATGNGSKDSKERAVFSVQSLVGSFPEQGRMNWIDDAIATMAGQEKVEQWNPKPPERDKPDQQVWEAMNENADLASGAPVTRYQEQNDLTHLRIHLGFAGKSLEALPQGANPAQVLQVLDGIGQHSIVHFAALSDDELRKEEVTAMQDQWEEMAKVADKIRAMLEQQAKQAQQSQQGEQQQMSEAQIKQMESQTKLQMMQQESGLKLQIERERMQGQMAIDTAKAQNDIRLRTAQAQANIQEDMATK